MSLQDPMLLDRYDGITEYLIYDEEQDTFAIQRVCDVEPYLDANKAAYNDAPSRWGEWARVASFDPAAQLHLMTKYGRDPFERGNEDLLERILNDSEYAFYRTRPGRVKLRRK